MQLAWARVFMGCAGGLIVALFAQPPLFAQQKAPAAVPRMAVVEVPFVGCQSDGQVGAIDAPKGTTVSLPIGAEAAQKLAYYKAASALGVLAPRGWHCVRIYGSGSEVLYVVPRPIDMNPLFSSKWRDDTGPAVILSNAFGDTSGRFEVAAVAARVFPAYRAFVREVTTMFDQPAGSYVFHPYPHDVLRYRSNSVLEYTTPAMTDGLGTRFPLKKNGSPIVGVAILLGRPPNLVDLTTRLPPELAGLAPVIVRQVEQDAKRPAQD